jgi:hypothetical protein
VTFPPWRVAWLSRVTHFSILFLLPLRPADADPGCLTLLHQVNFDKRHLLSRAEHIATTALRLPYSNYRCDAPWGRIDGEFDFVSHNTTMNTDAAAGVTCRRPSREANTQTLNPIVQQITTSRSSQDTHNETYDKPYRVSSHPSTKSHSESLPGDTDTNHAPGGGGGSAQEVEEGEGTGSISFTEKEDRTVAMKIDRVGHTFSSRLLHITGCVDVLLVP